MRVRWQKFTVFVVLISAILFFGAVAQATTLMFDGNICSGSCVQFAPIDQTYGDISGQLDVVYTARAGNGNAASLLDPISWWDTSYNDLINVAFANNLTSVAEIALMPSAGFSVTLNSFDLGAWPQTTISSQWTIYDSSYNLLASSGSISVGSGATTHYSTAPSLTNGSGLILQWGPAAYNVGIDNINFTVSSTSTPVPESSSMLFLATGLAGILGYGWRRKGAA